MASARQVTTRFRSPAHVHDMERLVIGLGPDSADLSEQSYRERYAHDS